MRKETSHKVIAQGLTTLLKLSEASQNVTLKQKVMNLAKKHIKDTNHWVKRICLKIIGTFNFGENLRLIADFIHSQDARVRSSAFSTLIMLHESGQSLELSMYSEACEGLNDDYESVREAALKMVCLLGNTYPESMVDVEKGGEQIRLVDDAFGKICQAVNDLSMHVRVQAAQLLGSMTSVSKRFLYQTLDKKLMSNMRKKKSLHERSSEMVSSGEWSTGKKWADDAPKELLDKDSISVVSSGACGAFVHGLEDEFMEVRSASVDALGSLALHHSGFASLSLDFLVDMFNDEIEGVRIKAIDCLTSISPHIVLREHQLETILGALEDFSIDVREGLHRMLAHCKLSTKDCLKMVVDRLLENNKKYPQDKISTWRCVQEIGSKHAQLTLPLVPQLLSIHPFFDTPEPDVEDPHYITLLILVLNAAEHCRTMLQLFEEHTIKHYNYLRVTLPSFVPHLEVSSVDFSKPQTTTAAGEFLTSLLDRVSGVKSVRAREQVIASVMPQLALLAQSDQAVAGASQFATLFISGQQLLGNLLRPDRLWCSNAATTVQSNAIKNSIAQLLTLSLKLQYLFVGLKKRELAAVKQFKIKALALHLVYIVRVSNLSALALCEHFLTVVENTQRYLTEKKIEPDEFSSGVFNAMASLDDLKPGAVARCLFPLLNTAAQMPMPRPNIKVRMCKAVLNGPSTSQDAPIKFTAGLVMAIPLDAEINALNDPASLRIRIHYPDDQTHISVPSSSHLRPNGSDHDYRLLTTALISHGVWTEACFVEITLCVELSEGELAHRAHYNIPPYLDICKPFKVYVSPKPVRRGI
ncbi:hypothetical protein AAG570_000310 [Ranatra chinensis]|uniref:Integrator complex subunit 4 n=1 Tax=Ranatra chinensis TaxID=642074 RepID=A0ABD0ZHW9_9HEMI